MDNLHAIIVYPSKITGDRFYGGNEWNAWGFEEGKKFVYVTETRRTIEYEDSIEKLPCATSTNKIMYWFNREKINISKFKTMIENLIDGQYHEMKNHICIASHGNLRRENVPEFLQSRVKVYHHAEGNKSQFLPIWDENEGRLNPLAGFDNIYACFFLNPPKEVAVIKHRISNKFSPLCNDFYRLQELKSDGKTREEYAKEIIKDYGGARSVHPFLQLLAEVQCGLFHRQLEEFEELEMSCSEQNKNRRTLLEILSDTKITAESKLKDVLNLCNEITIPENYKGVVQKISIMDNSEPVSIKDFPKFDQVKIFLEELDKINNPKKQSESFLDVVDVGVSANEGISKFNGKDFQDWVLELDQFLEAVMCATEFVEDLNHKKLSE